MNFSDPFGLCPYEGAVRSPTLKDCPIDMRRKAFAVLAGSATFEAREAIGIFIAAAASLSLQKGPFPCGVEPFVTECTSGTSVKIDGSRTPELIASDIVHATSHIDVPPGLSPKDEEIRAWDKALNFYESLDSAEQTGRDENAASRMRKNGRAQCENYLRARTP